MPVVSNEIMLLGICISALTKIKNHRVFPLGELREINALKESIKIIFDQGSELPRKEAEKCFIRTLFDMAEDQIKEEQEIPVKEAKTIKIMKKTLEELKEYFQNEKMI